MKSNIPQIRRALAGLIPAAALLAIPAVAQDAPVAPPPVVSTVPQATPPPAQSPPAATPTATTTSRTTIAPGAGDVVDDARRPAARAAPRAAASAPRVAARAPAPVRPSVATAPDRVPPVAVAPTTPAAAPVVETPAARPAAGPADTVATTDTTTEPGTPLWPIFAIAALALLGIVGFLARRRRKATDESMWVEEEYAAEPVGVAEPAIVEPAHVEPVVEPTRATDVAANQSWQVTAPVIKPRRPPVAKVAAAAAIPVEAVAAEDVTVSDAEASDVASLTDGPAPIADRPWLEFAMRPVRAGTNSDEALVEIELTVANAGNVAARDVRISTFMLPAASDSDMERLLLAPADTNVASTTIDPGQGTRIDATLAMLKTAIGTGGNGEGFTPVVIADARYRLPDGSEGRTSAAFAVGMPNDGGDLTPFALDERQMHDNIEARLHGEPQRA